MNQFGLSCHLLGKGCSSGLPYMFIVYCLFVIFGLEDEILSITVSFLYLFAALTLMIQTFACLGPVSPHSVAVVWMTEIDLRFVVLQQPY